MQRRFSIKIITLFSFITLFSEKGFSEPKFSKNEINPVSKDLAKSNNDPLMDADLVKKFIEMKKSNFNAALDKFMAKMDKIKPDDRAIAMTEIKAVQPWIQNINDIEKQYPKASVDKQKDLYEDLARNIAKLDTSIQKIKNITK